MLDRFTSRREEGKEPDKLLNESSRGAPNFSYPRYSHSAQVRASRPVPSPPVLKKGNPGTGSSIGYFLWLHYMMQVIILTKQ